MASWHNSRDEDERGEAFRMPNQFARIIGWLDTDTDDMIDDPNAPFRILQRESREHYAYWGGSVTSGEARKEYIREHGSTVDDQWIGIVEAAGLSGNSSPVGSCHAYHPQLFYGRWAPIHEDDQPRPDRGAPERPRFSEETHHIFLPRTVRADRVEESFPLGLHKGDYHICGERTDAEGTGYHYIAHPEGNYCERAE